MKFVQSFTGAREKALDIPVSDSAEPGTARDGVRLEHIEKSRWDRIWPTIACGAGLFSDGYLNSLVQEDNTQIYVLTIP